MTVKELIQKLLTMPQDSIIMINDDGRLLPASKVEFLEETYKLDGDKWICID